MNVIIDADACPVIKIVEQICISYKINLILVSDTSHIISSDFAKIITASKGADSADFEILKILMPNDILITQDYGLASLALLKKAKVLNQNGLIYNDDNIMQLLDQRAFAKKLRKSSKNHLKGPSKRTSYDDEEFVNSFKKILDL